MDITLNTHGAFTAPAVSSKGKPKQTWEQATAAKTTEQLIADFVKDTTAVNDMETALAALRTKLMHTEVALEQRGATLEAYGRLPCL